LGNLPVVLGALLISLLAGIEAQGEEWIFYAGSSQGEVHDATLREWYGLNRFMPVSQNEATALHYYDRDSVASNSPFPGGTVRVWEKSVLKKTTKPYEEAKAEVEKEESAKLKRQISVLDYAWIFPMAVNRATKEITIYLEINCDTGEYFIKEANTYDKTGARMTQEKISDMYFWSLIRPGTLVAMLSQNLCQ